MNNNFDFTDEEIRCLMSTGGDRYDTSKTCENEDVREYILRNLISNNTEKIDAVIGLETYGLTLGVLIANKINTKFIPIREKGKIPAPTDNLKSRNCNYIHRRKYLELDNRRFKSIDNVLLVDDWIESGKQVLTALDLLSSVDVEVVEISVIGIDENFDHSKIKNVKVNTVI